jgi:DNA repair exonuclease SbcCD nuclease subunit
MILMSRVCCISDIHLGCHCDSEHWHTIILDWGKWLRDELIKSDIDRMVICGDFFDNRSTIGVKTISVAGELMDLWADFDITLITGNHDLFYKNRNDVSSVSIFEGRPNIEIISDICTDEIDGKSITYIPWGCDISKVHKSDIIFGHLEINGFKMMPGRIADGKIPPKSITSRGKLTFSGHFHLRDERHYKSSSIIYVGSPYQLNWGESGNRVGYYIIDIGNMSYEFIENMCSPRHIKITSSDISSDGKCNINGNIIKVDMADDMTEDEIESIKRVVYSETPLEVKWDMPKIDYNVDISQTSGVDILETMNNFVDELKLDDFSTEVKDALTEIFKKHDR